MRDETVKYIISRILERAIESRIKVHEDFKNKFNAGRNEAYYEVLDIIQSEIDIADYDLKEFGLDIDLIKEIL